MSDDIDNPPIVQMKGGPEAITMYQEPDGVWVIKHHGESITTQGDTQYEALIMLADALCGVNGDSLEELQETAERVLDPTRRKND